MESLDVESLIDRYTDNLMRAAFSMGFADSEAEELVQDTFYAYLQQSEQFEKRSKILTYLFGILYNKAREVRRRHRRHESIDAPIDAAFDSQFDHEEHWNSKAEAHMSEVEKHAQTHEIGRWLQDCLNGLNDLMRMAFTMKEVEQLDTEAICESLGITPNALGVTLFRARNKLRDCLTAKGAVIV